MGWGALLRAGEVISGLRKNLLLPCDVGYTNNFALFSILEPKTRFSAARFQTAKLDVPDLLQFVQIMFGRLQPNQRLWPASGQTLRTRFRSLLRGLSLPAEKVGDLKPLDLGSLRAGGATWTLLVTESPPLVQRRGRWVNGKTMETYLQEISAIQFMAHLPSDSKSKVLALAEAFPILLQKIHNLHLLGVDPIHWRFLLDSHPPQSASKQAGKTGAYDT